VLLVLKAQPVQLAFQVQQDRVAALLVLLASALLVLPEQLVSLGLLGQVVVLLVRPAQLGLVVLLVLLGLVVPPALEVLLV
jgi:energy-coupling factor transporter transmembrane protein EcfT